MKSKIEIKSTIEYQFESSQLVQRYDNGLILLTVRIGNFAEINFEKANGWLTGVVVDPGTTLNEIGSILSQQDKRQYYVCKERVILEN